ncbi:N-acetylglucosaminyl-diphospho-decaprenol L-rhamnosyltransferase [compost metagenome]
MLKPQELTAVILHFRTPERTIGCMRSLIEQGIQRIVLVDNSEDGGSSLRTMQSALQTFQRARIELNILNEDRNLGFAAGVNLALNYINVTGASNVILINSDARLAPGCVNALSSSLQKGAAVTAPLLISPNGATRQPISYYQKHTGIRSDHKLPGAIAYLTGACIALSRDTAKPKLFDEDFFFYGEDIMLSVQLCRDNMRCTVTETAQILHEGAGSARNGSPFYEYHINRGHCLLAAKLADNGWAFTLNLTGRVFFLPTRAMIRSIRNLSISPIRGLFLAIWDVVAERKRTMTPPPFQ